MMQNQIHTCTGKNIIILQFIVIDISVHSQCHTRKIVNIHINAQLNAYLLIAFF